MNSEALHNENKSGQPSEALAKKGYKKTQLGWIPKEWGVKKVGELTKYQKGFAFKSSDFIKKDGRRVIKVSDTDFNGINDDDPTFLANEKAEEYKDYTLHEGDILFSTVGSRPPVFDSLVGKAVKVTEKYDGALLNQNNVIIRKKNNSKILQEFLYPHFRTNRYIYYITTIVRGNANQGSITLKDLFNYKIPVPLPPEQKKIAEILSTWDDAISKLDQLITKQEKLKKGLMQQLLTVPKGKSVPSKRFSGFNEEWKTFRLKDVGDVNAGGTPRTTTTKYWGGEIRWCTPTDITALDGNKFISITDRTITKDGLQNSSAKLLEANTIVVCTRATIGDMAIAKVPLATNQGFKNLTVNPEKANYEFIYYLLLTKKKNLIRKASGSTFLELNSKDFKKIKIDIPSIEEQKEIVRLFSSIDLEIKILEKQRQKFENQKKGLMQQLLTGKRRVYGDRKFKD